MAALFVEDLARDVGRADALITSGKFGFFRELLQFVDDRSAARQPHRQTGADVIVQDKDLQLAAKFAVVALFRFLEHREIFIEFLFRFEGRAVNALELRILFVAFVVGARHAGELERADVSGAHDVRAGAKIDEVAIAIEGDRFARRNVFDDIELELARSVPLI